MDADAHPDAEPCARDLLQCLERHLVGLFTAAMLPVEGKAEDPQLAEGAQAIPRELTGRLGLGDPGRELACRDLLDHGHELDGLRAWA